MTGTQTNGTAIVAARDEDEVSTAEIERLASAAGYEVIEAITQRRREDRTYNMGAGKARAVADRAADTDADVVVFDGRLTPGQHGDFSALLPADSRLIDRYRLVLEIFAAGAGSRRASLQVELARLNYIQPRVRQEADGGMLNVALEKGSRVNDIADRIARLERELATIERRDDRRRADRREEGFDLIALAGYTNAGKSTLLARLADELSVSETTHADETTTASQADRLFETLETATRRASIDGRRTLVTDTVGLIDELPHELVESFSVTLGEIRDSDVVIAVMDASAPIERFRTRAAVTMETVGAGDGVVLPALNKVDRIDHSALADRRAAIQQVAGGDGARSEAHENSDSESVASNDESALGDGILEPVAISAVTGHGIDALRERVAEALPADTASFTVPNSGDAQQLVSWCYDHGRTEVSYEGESVLVSFTSNPELVAEARRRGDRLG